jgi:hypothetical protein
LKRIVFLRGFSAEPQLSRIVVWDKVLRGATDPYREDPVKPAIGPAWKRTSEQIFTAFDHWTWQKLYDVRRREYTRVGTPATLCAGGLACIAGALLFLRQLPELRRAVRPVYVSRGILPAIDPDAGAS